MLELINREDYINKKHEEVRQEFSKMVDEYDEYIKDMTVEQAKEEEKRLMKVMDELDKVITGIEYELPKSCTFLGNPQEISRKTIGKYIMELLEKVECEYQYTLGYYELYQWWKDPQAKISYNNFNSTLQVLGTNMRFRGPHQWALILSINEFFKPLHNSYLIDNMMLHLYGSCHSKLIDKIQMNTPITEQPEPTVEEAEKEETPAE